MTMAEYHESASNPLKTPEDVERSQAAMFKIAGKDGANPFVGAGAFFWLSTTHAFQKLSCRAEQA